MDKLKRCTINIAAHSSIGIVDDPAGQWIHDPDHVIMLPNHFKTPYQLWYYATVYPESIEPDKAKELFEIRNIGTSEDHYWKAMYKVLYGREWKE